MLVHSSPLQHIVFQPIARHHYHEFLAATPGCLQKPCLHHWSRCSGKKTGYHVGKSRWRSTYRRQDSVCARRRSQIFRRNGEAQPGRSTATKTYLRFPYSLLTLVDVLQPGFTPGTLKAYDNIEEAVKGAWLVIESIPEKLPLKIEVFEQLDQLADPDAILATNSSSYRSGEMKEKVQGRHRSEHASIPIPDCCTCGFSNTLLNFCLCDSNVSSAQYPCIHASSAVSSLAGDCYI